jgi:hypothetical protein
VIDKRGHPHDFCFVFKNHRDLPINGAVKSLCPNTRWKGDIVILRTAVKFDGIVNMRTGDQELSDFVLKKYVQSNPLSMIDFSDLNRCVKYIQLGKRLKMQRNMTFSMCSGY